MSISIFKHDISPIIKLFEIDNLKMKIVLQKIVKTKIETRIIDYFSAV